MDNLQYDVVFMLKGFLFVGFKPYYKWIIFNISRPDWNAKDLGRFKPYYKWIIFNILSDTYTMDNQQATF